MITSPAPPGIDDVLVDVGRSTWASTPTALAFLAVLVGGWLAARLARRLVHRGLDRIGFDRTVRRTAVRRVLPGSAEPPAALCATLVHHVTLLLTLHVAFGLWGPNPVSALIAAVVAWLPRAVVAIVVVVVAAMVADAVRDLVRAALGAVRSGRVIGSLCHAVVVGLGVVAALNEVGIASSVTTPVLIAILGTVAGILVVGVGGGLVLPLQRRCARWLDRVLAEAYRVAQLPPQGTTAAPPQAAPGTPSDSPAEPAPASPGPRPAEWPADAGDLTQVGGASGADTGPATTSGGRPTVLGEDEPTVVLPVSGEPEKAPEPGQVPQPTPVVPVVAGPPVVPAVAGPVGAGPVGAGPVRGRPTVYRSGNAAAGARPASADDTLRLDLEELRSS